MDEWISVDDELPEVRHAAYKVAAIATKKVDDEASVYHGQGIMAIHQDWVIRRWPHNFTHYAYLPEYPE